MDHAASPKSLAAARPTIPCSDPATGQALGEVPAMDRAEVLARLDRARTAQAAWAKTSFAQRRRVVRRILQHLLDHTDELCRLISRDSGKTLENATVEMWPICEMLRWNLAHAEQALKPQKVSSGVLMHKSARIEYHPLGVIAAICPWNFPLQNVLAPAIPAILAGNAAMIKVSEWTSWSAPRIQQIFDEALRAEGHSTDLVQLITGYAETGAALVGAGVDKVIFTGSMANGKRVLQTAAETLTPVILELGGKDPMIVCDDADVHQAVHNALIGTLTSAGQLCMAAERIYVFDAVYDEFVAAIARIVGSLRQGPPLGGGVVDVGAMTMPGQVDIVERLVADAVHRGARILAGGKRGPGGQYFEPTVLVDVDHEMKIMREETFGPVIAIMRVRSDEEAIRLANDSTYGLSSSVFSRDRARAERIARQIVSGSTVINDFAMHYMAHELPFGGVRGSGFGRLNGPEGLRGLCNVKAVITDRLPIHAAVEMYPVRPGNYEQGKAILHILYSTSLAGRARGLVDMGKALWKRAAAKK
ncbi:aldehyde dehydrogenase family protein [Nannocystis bainbridge]|uniref:Aldehyde dehydrogenase n=1 Tax=Nannocystis bainbridge TaxID=2995303 RepID=A0ABT5DXZ1_9BACT|nr:aldehyde dehydrogenase family protein [Nannocystis bainbridge]MDC0718459.1 aldehyde dehydrogenase family protein [Nannocystis bainbridge]